VTRRKSRQPVQGTVADELMFRNRHTCCICHDSAKHVQIHHIDENPSNNRIENLAVLCLDCHSRVSSDQGLGRRFTAEELRRYKREWESLNVSALETESALGKVEAGVLRGGISQLMVQAITLSDTARRIEALEQIEAYYVYLGMREEALEAISTILYGSVWRDAAVTAECAERIHHLFWALPGPQHMAIKEEDLADLKTAIGRLDWIGEHATEYMRNVQVMRSLCTSILYLYDVVVAYSESDLGLALVEVVDGALSACTAQTEFEGVWKEGALEIQQTLRTLSETTPKRWTKARTAVKALLATAAEVAGR
jgi:hypothetical protein